MPAFARALRLDRLHSVPLHRAETMDFDPERLHLRFLAVHTRRANLWPSASNGGVFRSLVRIHRFRPSRRWDYACQVHRFDDAPICSAIPQCTGNLRNRMFLRRHSARDHRSGNSRAGKNEDLSPGRVDCSEPDHRARVDEPVPVLSLFQWSLTRPHLAWRRVLGRSRQYADSSFDSLFGRYYTARQRLRWISQWNYREWGRLYWYSSNCDRHHVCPRALA